MNYGTAGMLPVTGMGIAVAGHSVVLGTMIAIAVLAVALGCVLYRVGSRNKRINAS
jgi:hypothetical protein